MKQPLIPGMASLFAVTLGLALTNVPDSAANSITFDAMVVDVQDGDTLIVLRNKIRLTVELPGIDAPELDQPYGPEAKRFAAKLVKGRVVTIETSQASNPIYGGVRFSKKRILAHEMVKGGLAWATSMDKTSMLGKIQATAKAARLGLWANSEDEEPVPPWEWRANKRFK
jgi:endonuclease YncB( thermonuclease family)